MNDEPYQVKIFQPAREYLLNYQDERELVIRLCRDINSYSKKMIFTMHRVSDVMTSTIYGQLLSNLRVICEKLSILYNKFLYNDNFPQFKSTISNSIEEMIEGFTFAYYVINGDILSFERFSYIVRCLIISYNYRQELVNEELLNYSLCQLLFDATPNNVTGDFNSPQESVDFEVDFILPGDYLMGIFDLTGEIMRYSITNLVDNENHISAGTLKNLKILKQINKSLLEVFFKHPQINVNRGIFNTEFDSRSGSVIDKKLQTLKQSINKVENMIRDISIKGNELIDYNDHDLYNY